MAGFQGVIAVVTNSLFYGAQEALLFGDGARCSNGLLRHLCNIGNSNGGLLFNRVHT